MSNRHHADKDGPIRKRSKGLENTYGSKKTKGLNPKTRSYKSPGVYIYILKVPILETSIAAETAPARRSWSQNMLSWRQFGRELVYPI